MSDKIISAGVTIKDVILLVIASTLIMVAYFAIMVSLLGSAIMASFNVPLPEPKALECVYNCDDYNRVVNGLKMSQGASKELQPAIQVQHTQNVQTTKRMQQTINGKTLYE